MSEELTSLPPEEFLRLAVSRGGLALDDLSEDLSPQAARALAWIAQSSASPGGGLKHLSTPGSTAPAQVYRGADPPATPCPNCGQASRPGNRYCTHCGRELEEDVAPTTLEQLVEQGDLTEQAANEAMAAILLHQSHYLAGTRYSIFGTGA